MIYVIQLQGTDRKNSKKINLQTRESVGGMRLQKRRMQCGREVLHCEKHFMQLVPATPNNPDLVRVCSS
jgi:hypothetical protein